MASAADDKEPDLRYLIIKAVLAIANAEKTISPSSSQQDEDRPRVRMRTKGSNSSKHDARCDAVDYCVFQLLRHNVPLWAAIELGYHFADAYGNELHSFPTDFNKDKYESINTVEFNSKANMYIQKYLHFLGTSEAILPEKPKLWDDIKISVYESRNHKKDMEDKKIVLPKLSIIEPNLKHGLENTSLFAVFDGHGGLGVSTYAASHFPSCLVRRYKSGDKDFVANALRDLENRIIARTVNEHISGGSTAVVATWHPDKDQVNYAWVGDSAIGVLVSNEVVTITKPHNLQDSDECTRIKAEGGLIMNVFGENRVNGVLNITRALGDHNAKPIISAEPGVGSFKPHEAGCFMLFLASDGIWDFMSTTTIYNIVVSYIKTHPVTEFDGLSTAISTVALEESTDNVTLISVCLKSPEEIWNYFNSVPLRASIDENMLTNI